MALPKFSFNLKSKTIWKRQGIEAKQRLQQVSVILSIHSIIVNKTIRESFPRLIDLNRWEEVNFFRFNLIF